MDQTTLLYVMTAFVIIAAVALSIQAGMLVAVNKKTKDLHDKITAACSASGIAGGIHQSDCGAESETDR